MKFSCKFYSSSFNQKYLKISLPSDTSKTQNSEREMFLVKIKNFLMNCPCSFKSYCFPGKLLAKGRKDIVISVAEVNWGVVKTFFELQTMNCRTYLKIKRIV